VLLQSFGTLGTKGILTYELKFTGTHQNRYVAGAHDTQAGAEGTGFLLCREETTRRFNCTTQGRVIRDEVDLSWMCTIKE